jgi:hypothetical protein
VPDDDKRYLTPASTTYELTRDQFVDFLSRSDEPVIVDDEREPKAEVLAALREDRLGVSE